MSRSISERFIAERLSIVILLFAFVGCAGLDPPTTLESRSAGKRVIQMRASSFAFEPNNIRIPEPGSLTLEVENISESKHNITIKNPKGEVLQSVDLPPEKTVSFTQDFPVPGRYEFYCDITFHTSLGMKGQIQVEAAQP